MALQFYTLSHHLPLSYETQSCDTIHTKYRNQNLECKNELTNEKMELRNLHYLGSVVCLTHLMSFAVDRSISTGLQISMTMHSLSTAVSNRADPARDDRSSNLLEVRNIDIPSHFLSCLLLVKEFHPKIVISPLETLHLPALPLKETNVCIEIYPNKPAYTLSVEA